MQPKAARSNVTYKQDDRVRAALLDFGGNVEAAPPRGDRPGDRGGVPFAAYRGWVGGIVSVDARHVSRLSQPGTAFYYLVTVTLQLIPYILTGGAGMYLGLVAWRRRNDASVRSLLGLRIPGEAIRDVGWIWALALPIFLAGSLFEFLQYATSTVLQRLLTEAQGWAQPVIPRRVPRRSAARPSGPSAQYRQRQRRCHHRRPGLAHAGLAPLRPRPNVFNSGHWGRSVQDAGPAEGSAGSTHEESRAGGIWSGREG